MASHAVRDDKMRRDGQMRCILMPLFCTCQHGSASVKQPQPHLCSQNAIHFAMKCHAIMILLSCTQDDSEGKSMAAPGPYTFKNSLSQLRLLSLAQSINTAHDPC